MDREASSWSRRRFTVLPVLASVLAAVIFILDILTPPDVAMPVLYVVVVLIGARLLQWRGILTLAVGCVALALTSHAMLLQNSVSTVPLINLVIGSGAILTSAYLAVLIQASEMAARDRASLLDVAHDAIFVRDLDDAITYWNRGAVERYGWTRAEALGRRSHDLLHTVFPVSLETIEQELMHTGHWEGELVHTRRDGSTVVVASRWSLRRDEHGQPLATLETNNDISQQKQADAELRASVRKYRNIFQTVGVSIWEEDFSEVKAAIDALKAHGVSNFRRYLAEHPEFTQQAISKVKLLDVNDFTLQLFGARSKDELLDSLSRIFLPETETVFVQELISLAEGKSSLTAETALQTLRGERLDVLFTITFPAEPAAKDSVLVSIFDNTQRKRAQEALERAQANLAHVNRVSTTGELAASIAHEVTQPIASVITATEAASPWLARSPPDLEEIKQSLDAIAVDGRRALEILGRIRALLNNAPVRKEPLDINQVIREVVALANNDAARKDVTLQMDFQSALPWVAGDRVQLQQVVLNFVLNAIDATIGLENDRRNVVVSTASSNSNSVIVAVRDMGVGIDAETADKLFEPFFTTKASGMGMGLSICRSIIEAHDGRTWATYNADTGTIFQFTLPATASEGDATDRSD
jgi:PAS domain S-box-containing protein